ncbi:11234_t:CDS:1, partial [Funneliformis mosseae]
MGKGFAPQSYPLSVTYYPKCKNQRVLTTRANGDPLSRVYLWVFLS